MRVAMEKMSSKGPESCDIEPLCQLIHKGSQDQDNLSMHTIRPGSQISKHCPNHLHQILQVAIALVHCTCLKCRNPQETVQVPL
jgi:hypothetical protein